MVKSRGQEIGEMELLDLAMTNHHLRLLTAWLDILYPRKDGRRSVNN